MRAQDFGDDGVYRVGRVVGAVSARYDAKKTEPPRRYTQSDLMDDMMAAHKFARNDQERQVLRQIDGLGTARTREATITGLIDRGFLTEKKSMRERGRTELIPTATARAIISELPEMLTSVGTTANWELAFRMIEQGKAEPQDAQRYLAQMLERIVAEAKAKGKIALPAQQDAAPKQHFGKSGGAKLAAGAVRGAISGRAARFQ